jgi:hypothetical protein
MRREDRLSLFDIRLLSRLTFEIADAVGWNEKSSNSSIRIVSPEIAPFAVEPDQSVRPFRFQNICADAAIAQLLRQPEILLPGDGAEFVPVFFEMILKQMFGAKSLSTGEDCAAEREDRGGQHAYCQRKRSSCCL